VIRLPNKRSVLVPTQREVALMLFAAAGGVWLWAAFVDWIDRRRPPIEAERVAAMASDMASYSRRGVGPAVAGSYGVKATWVADAVEHMRKRGAL